MVPVEQLQLGRRVTVYAAQEEALPSSPSSGGIRVQLGSERGPAWGVCGEEEHGHSSHGLCQGPTGPL